MNIKSVSAKVLGVIVSAVLMPFGVVHAVPMNVTASVNGTCIINGVVDVTFGDISADQGTSNDVDFDGSFDWRCSNGADVDIFIDEGQNSTGPVWSAPRADWT